MGQPQPQSQQQAAQGLEQAMQQLEAAHGLASGINWASLIPLIIEAIRIISSGRQGAPVQSP